MLIVITGNGKGKTTSAIGQAVRAVGDQRRVLMVQFIKGPWRSGEDDAQMLLRPYFKIIKTGLGFVGVLGDTVPLEDHARAAQEGLDMARREMLSGQWDLLILDEVNNVIQLELLSLADIMAFVDRVPDGVDLILTGRDARQELIERADVVSQIDEINSGDTSRQKDKKSLEW
jgi:cob(I)alamin adenosyltransferase